MHVDLKGFRAGNAALDGEVVGNLWKMAIEIKSGHDDVTRGLRQLVEALSHSYQTAALLTSLRRARRLDRAVFHNGLLLGVDSKPQIHKSTPNVSLGLYCSSVPTTGATEGRL